MDLIILIGIASALFIIFLTMYFFQKKDDGKSQQQRSRVISGEQIQEGIPRRAQIARNQRNRLRLNATAEARPNEADRESSNDEEHQATHSLSDEKMGAKKRAKLEAKEQKRLQREQEMKFREEKKAKEAKLEEEQKKIKEKEAEIERKQEEAERLAGEERARKEQEEYMKMKAAFSIEEEGFEEDEESENLLADFIQYIKDNKVVVLEDLASEFKLKTQQAIERITELQANGTLTGVIDDRGKFIYVSDEELRSVAKFIKQRGRVSIVELAESSNKLINLTPVASA